MINVDGCYLAAKTSQRKTMKAASAGGVKNARSREIGSEMAREQVDHDPLIDPMMSHPAAQCFGDGHAVTEIKGVMPISVSRGADALYLGCTISTRLVHDDRSNFSF
jgi:hypothetical protein